MIQWYETGGYLVLDDIAKRNLELFTTIAGTTETGSLFHVLNETVTAMGARRLRWWLELSPDGTGKNQGTAGGSRRNKGKPSAPR